MKNTSRRAFALVVATAGVIGSLEALTLGQSGSLPNPYRPQQGWAVKLPGGRQWGSSAGIDVDRDGNLWVAERCGENAFGCVDKAADPILNFAPSGTLLRTFGKGRFVQPHGMTVDRDGNVWVTDVNARNGKGQQVFKFSARGEVLMTLGRAGLAGDGPDTFNWPTAVAIASNGDVFVADGHNGCECNNARILKFSKDGRLLMQFGKKGSAAGDLDGPHALAFDSKGRLFVGDRTNNRISIFSQQGKFIESWKQFGRPSGIFIGRNDAIFVTDSESRSVPGYGYNPGWPRGIRIGSAQSGKVTAFIPDADPDPEHQASSGGEGVAVDLAGNVYSVGDHAQALPAQKKFVKK